MVGISMLNLQSLINARSTSWPKLQTFPSDFAVLQSKAPSKRHRTGPDAVANDNFKLSVGSPLSRNINWWKIKHARFTPFGFWTLGFWVADATKRDFSVR